MTPNDSAGVPLFPLEAAAKIARDAYGIEGVLAQLPSEWDQNFHVRNEPGGEFLLKIANENADAAFLEAQNTVLRTIEERDPFIGCPRLVRTVAKNDVAEVLGGSGQTHAIRMLTFVPGIPLATVPHDARLMQSVGSLLGRIDQALAGLDVPALRRRHRWDLEHGSAIVREFLSEIESKRQSLVLHFLERFEETVKPLVPELRSAAIHGDGNNYNVLVRQTPSGHMASGIVDFGDMAETRVVFEVAVAAAYAAMDKDDPYEWIAQVVRGYDAVNPLEALEIEILPDLIAMRLCVSVAIGAFERSSRPDNEYLTISQAGAWSTLEKLRTINPHRARAALVGTHRRTVHGGASPTAEDLLEERRAKLGPSLSLSYAEPLHIVRGWMQYLYDESGRAYLDTVNNVCHVGHCHPRVVDAARRQMEMLNTNTRYLHEAMVEYARRLCASLPDPLNVCYLVCSGSEANELALRLARAHTGRRGVVVLDGAYHGNTSSLVDISPYKFDGPGGHGAPAWVYKTPMPDPYRDASDDDTTPTGTKFVASAVEQAAVGDHGMAAFFCESVLSCGGQIVLPPSYLRHAYEIVRAAGGVCVADEVQVGFGRVGSHFWAFETQGVIPDIVTLGKPMGNGHPVGAVVTTRAIAESFDNGMEYFNTFGGNPVSSAVGLAVLDVIEDENLQQNAAETGDYLASRLEALGEAHSSVGHVRGMGLFLGVELVKDRETREPDSDLARSVVERMKSRRVLASVDGPMHNVIKFKPPMVFSEENAEYYAGALDEALHACQKSG